MTALRTDTFCAAVPSCGGSTPQAYGAFEFNARLSDPLWDGARFDATEADKYPYLYAGLSDGHGAGRDPAA